MKNFVGLKDVKDLTQLLDLAKKYKNSPTSDLSKGVGKSILTLFFQSSLRTRLSTQRAAQLLGLDVLDVSTSGLWNLEFEDGAIMNQNSAEHIQEAVKVMSQYADILSLRSFATLKNQAEDYQDHVINTFIKHSEKPIVSLESAIRHPLQSLTDIITIEENKKQDSPKIVLTWAPHPKALPQAVANSFLEWTSSKYDNVVVTHPQGLELDQEFTTNVKYVEDPKEAFKNADFIYAKNWSSYKNYGQRLEGHTEWIVDKEKMDLTNNANFMHCLPVRRNVVVADEVIDNPNSLVIPQAENRLFAAMAVLSTILDEI
jgi:N-succinyl-L-ornithine transcarbamylase